jgi:cell division protein FtsB
MSSRAWLTLVLVGVLLMLQAQLWWGRGSVPKVRHMQQELRLAQTHNQQAQLRNDQLRSEVRDLKNGLAIIEEKARLELGMVKPNEVFVQMAQERR